MCYIKYTAKGSGYLKLETSTGWWELRSEPPQAVEAWVEAISRRLENFREARRRSVAVSVLMNAENLDAKLLAWRARKSGPRASNILAWYGMVWYVIT